MIKEHLFNIQRLCFKYGKAALADWAEQSLELYCCNQREFFLRLDSSGWWDNMRCLCKMHLNAPDHSIPVSESSQDTELLQRSLVVIYEEMTKAGYTHKDIGRAVETFRFLSELNKAPG